MLVFDVFVNGEAKCRAGVSGGVLNAMVSYRRAMDGAGAGRPESLDVWVDGLEHPDEHISWLFQSLNRGDTVTIEIREADNADEPRARKRPPRPDPANPPKLRVAKRGTR